MNIAKAVKREIAKISPKSDIILFGSRARGSYRKDSDWDFLILLEKKKISKKEKEKIREKLYEIELASEEVISPIIYTRQEWEKRAITPIYQIIKKEGKKI